MSTGLLHTVNKANDVIAPLSPYIINRASTMELPDVTSTTSIPITKDTSRLFYCDFYCGITEYNLPRYPWSCLSCLLNPRIYLLPQPAAIKSKGKEQPRPPLKTTYRKGLLFPTVSNVAFFARLGSHTHDVQEMPPKASREEIEAKKKELNQK